MVYSIVIIFLEKGDNNEPNVPVRMAWISFGALPYRENLMTARVSMLLKSRASLTCFRACFLPGRAKDLSDYTLSEPKISGGTVYSISEVRHVKETKWRRWCFMKYDNVYAEFHEKWWKFCKLKSGHTYTTWRSHKHNFCYVESNVLWKSAELKK